SAPLLYRLRGIHPQRHAVRIVLADLEDGIGVHLARDPRSRLEHGPELVARVRGLEPDHLSVGSQLRAQHGAVLEQRVVPGLEPDRPPEEDAFTVGVVDRQRAAGLVSGRKALDGGHALAGARDQVWIRRPARAAPARKTACDSDDFPTWPPRLRRRRPPPRTRRAGRPAAEARKAAP